MTWADLIRDALMEIAVIDPIDPTPWELQTLGLSRLNGIINQRNAQQISVYTVTFPTFTTTSGLTPHTIGPTGATWTATQRPVAIIAANYQTGSGVSLIRIPIDIRDEAWWFGLGAPSVQAGVPTDLYYSPSWVNGSVYLWPVPNAAYTIELEVRTLISEIAEADITDDFSMPPGYQRDLMLTLAEDLTSPLGIPMPEGLSRKASLARSIVQGNNNNPVRIQTRQSGMPGGQGTSGGFNWVTGRGGGR